ncbi:MAG: Dyp-type peroxidase, partial [Frankiales bacterium]|nr:Dyp-type peroxidase [Frankiales bacterium]
MSLTRRSLLGLAGAGAVGVGLAAAGPLLAEGGPSLAGATLVPFHGPHQAGITTAVQGHLHVASFDVTTTDRSALVALLQRWTRAAEQLTAGREVGEGATGAPLAPPDDTGEALGHDAARLTLTFGVGPSLFDDRFGLAARRPAALADLPAFPKDALDPARCGGDLFVQACADDPQVAVHAIRTLSRLAAGAAAVRWAQLGFGKASATTTDGPTPRNLFGFKDGTANLTGTDAAGLDEHVWAGADDGWMTGGSYLVARRIRMTIETWDRTSLAEQERVTGRTKREGAPLGGSRERD